MDMKSSSFRNHERYLKWERRKVENEMSKVIMEKAVPLAERLIQIAMDGNPNAINSLLDRVFGKARQNIGIDGGAEDKPIVFMPASLMGKYGIQAAQYTELEEDKESEEYKENGPAGMLIEPVEEV